MVKKRIKRYKKFQSVTNRYIVFPFLIRFIPFQVVTGSRYKLKIKQKRKKKERKKR
jgi:hypothetical protein